jgi:hypothetical protein
MCFEPSAFEPRMTLPGASVVGGSDEQAGG